MPQVRKRRYRRATAKVALKKRPIYLIEADTGHLISSAFIRFQEHYEGPKFRGMVFDLEEFMDWYADEYGTFSYYTDWIGFNFPSRVLRPFREGRFDPLTRKEKMILEMFAGVKEPFYVIGTKRGAYGTLRHEIVHALFYSDLSYQKKVRRTIRRFNTDNFRKVLEEIGYHPKVLEDEINAYSTTGAEELEADGLKYKRTKALRRVLTKLFKDHFGFSIMDLERDQLLNLVHRRVIPTTTGPV